MADTRLSDLSAAGALSASDLFYVVQTPGSGGEKATGTQLLTLVGTTYVPLGGGTMTGALTIASGTLTASAPALSITQTWNSAGVAFSSLSFNITRVAENGLSTFLSATTSAGAYLYFYANGGVWLGNSSAGNYIDTTGVSVGSGLTLGFSSTASGSGTYDVALRRDAAAQLALRNGTNAQTLRVYGTYTDSSNYERLSLSTTAGSSVNITAETLGTGGDNLDIVLTPAGTGKVGIGGAPSWKLSVISSTTTCDLAVKDSVGALILTTSSGAAFLTTNTASPIIFRTSSTERMRLGDNGLLSFGDVTASYPALKRSATALQFRLADDSGYADAAVRNLLVNPVAFASLVAAATAGNGARSYINNCSHSTFGTAADGGGAISVPVWSNGSSWLVG